MDTELKETDPPKDVQETMNKVVKAENEKIAAIDSATAAETVADGVKRAKIKEAEGFKQSKILQASNQLHATNNINNSWYFLIFLILSV
jgi:regulator of protease activity HflC (stomatin/prohibitin superfamily)